MKMHENTVSTCFNPQYNTKNNTKYMKMHENAIQNTLTSPPAHKEHPSTKSELRNPGFS